MTKNEGGRRSEAISLISHYNPAEEYRMNWVLCYTFQ